MGQMQPAPVRLDGVRTFPVLHFLDGVVETPVDDFLVLDDGVFHAVHQGPADTAAVAGIDETVLRAGVQGIFSVHEFGMKHYIALLGRRTDVRQALPVHQVPGTGHTGCRRSGRKVSLGAVILAFHAENAVNPAVLMGSQAHIVHIGGGFSPFREGDGTGPEAEVVHTVRAFGHGKERLAVGSFHTHHQDVFPVPFDGARIQGGMYADTLHQVGIALPVKIVPPLERSMLRRQDGVFITLVNAVSFDGRIGPFNQFRMVFLEPCQSFVKVHQSEILYCRFH